MGHRSGRPRGIEVLMDLGGVRAEILEDDATLERATHELCRFARARVLQVSSFRHEPPGFTVVAVLPQGHFTLHSQTDTGAVFINLFVRGTRLDDDGLVALAEQLFRPERTGFYTCPRAMPDREGTSVLADDAEGGASAPGPMGESGANRVSAWADRGDGRRRR